MNQEQGEKKLAPIAVFVYNRPEHTRQMLLNLQACEGFSQSPLYVFSDGAKDEKSAAAVREVRCVVNELVGSHATVITSSENKGLANSIIAGVTKLIEQYGRVIVLEDDLVVSPIFLNYMNSALDKYENCEQVFQISGHMFDVPAFEGSKEAFFLPFTTSWGWATWSRAWDTFDEQAKDWMRLQDDTLRNTFNINGAFDYYAMLKRQMQGRSDSWAIRWYWSVFKQEGLVVFPPYSLVDNTGFDGSGTHGWRSAKGVVQTKSQRCGRVLLPDGIYVEPEKFELVRRELSQMNPGIAKYFHFFKDKVLSTFQ
jgi:hypothetical protein